MTLLRFSGQLAQQRFMYYLSTFTTKNLNQAAITPHLTNDSNQRNFLSPASLSAGWECFYLVIRGPKALPQHEHVG